MKNLFALTVLEVINLGFQNTPGFNPYYIGFENRKGNSVYVSLEDDKVKVSAFKVSRRCSYVEIQNESDIEKAKNELITKLKLVV